MFIRPRQKCVLSITVSHISYSKISDFIIASSLRFCDKHKITRNIRSFSRHLIDTVEQCD